MAPKKKLQVFVSSTYVDLKEERQAAVEAILKAGHIPAGMELFTAGDQSQWELIKQWIDDCDAYLLILGGRYGSIDPGSGKSYTQLEYEYAVEKGKPYFALVVTDEYQEKRVKKHGTKVSEKEEPKKLKEFREMVGSKIVEFWSDPRDIKSSIAIKLSEYNHRPDLKGWTNGIEASNIGFLMQRISELKKEITRLHYRIGEPLTITFPINGETVPHKIILEGLIHDVNANLWIITHPIGNQKYWVQPKPNIKSDGTWKAKVHIGRAGLTDIGNYSEIRAVGNPKLKIKDGDILDAWPEGDYVSDIIELLRGKEEN